MIVVISRAKTVFCKMAEPQRFALPRLNNQNYQSWKFKIEMMLIRDELWHVIADPKPEPVKPEWTKADLKARATICLCLEDSQTSIVRTCTSAKAAWKALKDYHDKGSEVYLLKKLTRLELREEGDMEQHLQNFTELLQRIADAGDEIPKKLQVAMLLCSLPDSYDPLVTAMEQRPADELTLDLVKSKLLAEAEKRRERSGSAAGGGGGEKALRTDFRKQHGRSSDGNKDTRSTCFHCKKPGHFKRNCHAWKKEMAESSGKKQDGSSQPKKNDEAKAKKASVADEPLAWMVGHGEPSWWFVDSGASRHMTGDAKFFKVLSETKGTSVMLADGERAVSTGIGQGTIVGMNSEGEPVDIVLRDVLCVPKLTSGLISVSTLASKGFKVVFCGDRCEIRDKQDRVMAVALRHGSLYRLCTPEQALLSIQSPHTVNCQHTWHRRLGHRDIDVVRAIPVNGNAEGMKLIDCGDKTICQCCLKGKMSRVPFPKQVDRGARDKLDLVHTDLSGPMTSTPSGNKYFLSLIDDYTRMTFVYLLRYKSEAAEKIKQFVNFCKTQIGKTPRILQSDGGGEYTGKELQTFLQGEGIVCQFTAPYSPQQNGVAERKNRYLKEMTMCMLLEAGLEQRFWGEAVLTATYIQNRLPTKSIGVSPFERWYSKKPSLEHFRIFGCEAWVQIPAEKRKKMEVKSRKMVFVGYSNQHKAYRFLDTGSDRITISRDVKFVEDLQMNKNLDEKVIRENVVSVETNVELEPLVKNDEEPDQENDILENESDEEQYSEEEELEEEEVSDSERTSQARSEDRRRSTRNKLPVRFKDYELGLVAMEQNEPATFKEAVSGPEKEEWLKAMKEELKSLTSNATWELVDPPANRNIIGSKWVYRKKLNAEGEVERFKARLVAQGFTQRFGFDYEEIFAPVAMQSTLRVLLAVAGRQKMTVKHLDVKSAYLYGTLSEEIYMRQPPGFVVQKKAHQVCRLRKSIYGLKQAARVWHQTITQILMELGFSQCKSDSCLYRKRLSSGEWIYLLLYVDDILVVCVKEEEITSIERALQQKIQITKLGEISCFLGIRVRKDESGFYSLSQESFIKKLVKRYGKDGAKGSKYPMDPGYFKLSKDAKKLKDNEEYHSLIGSLLYLSTNSRPDIAACVGILSRRISCPSEVDWTESQRIIRYLAHTVDYRLKLGKKEEKFELAGYCDADWAGDTSDRKSCSGYVFRIGGATVSWASRKQGCVTLSTMEAEYVSLSEAAHEVVWLRNLLKELNEEQIKPTVMFEDNRSCLDFVALDQHKKRTKHIDTRYHYTRELSSSGVIELRYCPSEEMLADILTKPLGATKVKRFATELGLVGKPDVGGEG